MYYENITVDIVENNLPPVVYAKQGDTARGVRVELTENGLPYTIPTTSTCFINVRRKDGTQSTLKATLKDNALTADFTAKTTATAGRAIGDVSIYDGGKRLLSFLFIIRVVESALDVGRLKASDEYEGLAEILSEISDAETMAQAAKNTAAETLEKLNATGIDAIENRLLALEDATADGSSSGGTQLYGHSPCPNSIPIYIITRRSQPYTTWQNLFSDWSSVNVFSIVVDPGAAMMQYNIVYEDFFQDSAGEWYASYSIGVANHSNYKTQLDFYEIEEYTPVKL